MPELPEVEVVRSGLARWMIDARLTTVEVRHPRPIRRHQAGAEDFASRLIDVTVLDVVRRGKFLWLTLDSGEALLAHLGMSGQLVLAPPEAPSEPHLRVRIGLASQIAPAGKAEPALPVALTSAAGPAGDLGLLGAGGRELRFIDQRMFGGLAVVSMVKTVDGLPGGLGREPGEPVLPLPVAHIARDALDPNLDVDLLAARLRRRKTGLKRALLDQTLISGIGNIYADEALWQAKLHYARPTETLNRPALNRLLVACQQVMKAALSAGGTSFDSLYVDVNGQSGYFDRSLHVYGRVGQPCHRCATLIRRVAFMNRSSYLCPHCQPRPRKPRW
jgi:formamidopyrimidine-DNA glycosylase